MSGQTHRAARLAVLRAAAERQVPLTEPRSAGPGRVIARLEQHRQVPNQQPEASR